MTVVEDADEAKVRNIHLRMLCYFGGLGGLMVLALLNRSRGHFIPAAAILGWATTAVIGFDVVVAGAILFAMRSALFKPRTQQTRLWIFLALTCILVMVSTIGFPVFSIELPDLYTREFGAPSTMRVLVTKWEAGCIEAVPASCCGKIRLPMSPCV